MVTVTSTIPRTKQLRKLISIPLSKPYALGSLAAAWREVEEQGRGEGEGVRGEALRVATEWEDE